jgi:hypothetical protein
MRWHQKKGDTKMLTAIKLTKNVIGAPADAGKFCIAYSLIGAWLYLRPIRHRFSHEQRIILAANKSLEQSRARDIRIAAAVRALYLCSTLTVSRARLTQKTMIAANRARRIS